MGSGNPLLPAETIAEIEEAMRRNGCAIDLIERICHRNVLGIIKKHIDTLENMEASEVAAINYPDNSIDTNLLQKQAESTSVTYTPIDISRPTESLQAMFRPTKWEYVGPASLTAEEMGRLLAYFSNRLRLLKIMVLLLIESRNEPRIVKTTYDLVAGADMPELTFGLSDRDDINETLENVVINDRHFCLVFRKGTGRKGNKMPHKYQLWEIKDLPPDSVTDRLAEARRAKTEVEAV